jgi:small subunit ribosomal protein S19
MGRSSWKGPFVNSDLSNSLIKTKARNTSIVPDFVGKTFQVYNGKSYVKILVNEDMIGHKLGEFSSTRKIFSFKRKLNK